MRRCPRLLPFVSPAFSGLCERTAKEKKKARKERRKNGEPNELPATRLAGRVGVQSQSNPTVAPERFAPPRASPRHWRRCAHPLPRSLLFSPSRVPVRSPTLILPPSLPTSSYSSSLSLALSSTLFPIWLLDYHGVSSGRQEPMM